MVPPRVGTNVAARMDKGGGGVAKNRQLYNMHKQQTIPTAYLQAHKEDISSGEPPHQDNELRDNHQPPTNPYCAPIAHLLPHTQ